ncbi:MAG: hypothetical protein ABI378_00140 [Chitinophagaceae bacterium]
MKKTMLLAIGIFFALSSQAQNLDVINTSPCSLTVYPQGVYPSSTVEFSSSITLPPVMVSPYTFTPASTISGPTVPPTPPGTLAYPPGWD